MTTTTIGSTGTRPRFGRLPALMVPKEHGSWSLALEPIVLGLLLAPSLGGAWLALAVLAAFFARRPLRIALHEPERERRDDAVTALSMCAMLALVAFALSLLSAGVAWIIWLTPVVLAGAVFVAFDIRNRGRAEAAEFFGATAFGVLPAVFVAMDHGSVAVSIAAALVMLVRSVPAVVAVRAILRARKTDEWRTGRAYFVSLLGVATLYGLIVMERVTSMTGLLLSLFVVPPVLLLAARRTARARTVGMIEAVLGAAYVMVAGFGFCR